MSPRPSGPASAPPRSRQPPTDHGGSEEGEPAEARQFDSQARPREWPVGESLAHLVCGEGVVGERELAGASQHKGRNGDEEPGGTQGPHRGGQRFEEVFCRVAQEERHSEGGGGEGRAQPGDEDSRTLEGAAETAHGCHDQQAHGGGADERRPRLGPRQVGDRLGE